MGRGESLLEEVIEVIRAIDPDNIILVEVLIGTRICT